MSALCTTSSRVAPGASPLSILKTARTPKRRRSELTGWSLTDAGFEWISPSLKEHTLPLLESTWDGPHTAGGPARQGVSRGITTGAMTEATIAAMIATTTETITDHTDADLHLLTTAGGLTALDPGHGPTHHGTTEQKAN